VKAFRFPLDRALHIRRAQLEIEQAKHQRLLRDREQLELNVMKIQTETAAARNAIATQALLVPGEISTMPDYLRSTKQSLLKLDQTRQELVKKTQEHRRQLLEAERRVKLLEKLRTKRLGAWEIETQKEQETFAADAYLARWIISS
jgi:flagellar export protein FliJ